MSAKPSAWLVKYPGGSWELWHNEPATRDHTDSVVPLWTAEEMARALEEEARSFYVASDDPGVRSGWLAAARYIRDHLSGPREETSK